MPRVLNIFFSSRKDHAAANYLHSEISQHLLSRGYEVTGLCLSGNAMDWPDHIQKPTYFWSYTHTAVKGKKLLASFLLRRRLRQLIKEGQFDAIICDGLGVLNLLAKLEHRILPPIVTIQHAPPRKSDKPSTGIKGLLEQSKLTVVAISDMVKERLYRAGYGDESQIQRIPNAINFSKMRREQLQRDEAKSLLSVNNTDFVIGTIGRLVSCKQHKLLLEAVANLKNQGSLPSDCRVVVIGDGPELENLKSYSQANQLDDYVVFTGLLENASRYVKAFELFVMTSNEEEGFGLVILEAIAGNVPVLANDTPVFRDLVVDDDCRFSLNDAGNLADRILSFYRLTREEREAIAYRQSEYAVSRYDIERFNASYEALIQQIAARH